MPSWYAPDREPLIRPAAFVVLVGLVVIGFLAVFPDKDEFVDSMLNSEPDHVSVAYLRLFLDSRQGDPELRYTLAEQLRATRRMDEALRVLEPLLTEPGPLRTRANFLAFQIHWTREHDERLDLAVREQAHRAARTQLEWLYDRELEADQIETLARVCLQIEMTERGAILFERLARVDRVRRAQWLGEAARWFLASEKPHRAAELFVEASHSGRRKDRAREHAIAALNAWMAAGQLDPAIRQALEYVEDHGDDPRIVELALDLALQGSRHQLAVAWGRKLLTLRPDDINLLNRQIDLELGQGLAEPSFELARQLVAVDPGNPELRRRFARVAEWTGNTREALHEHAALARLDENNVEHLRAALRLSKAFQETEVLTDMLDMLGQRNRLSDDEMELYVAACEREGYPEKGRAFLEQRLEEIPDVRTLEVLHGLHVRLGSPAEALEILELKHFHHGSTPEEVRERAILHWKLDQPEQALDVLADHAASTCPDDPEFWTLMAELGWTLEADAEALVGYRNWWNLGERDGVMADRLIDLARLAGREEEAVRVALDAWVEFEEPRFLVQAMESLWRDGRRQEVVAMMRIAELHESVFMEFEYYLILRAILLERTGDHDLARFYYERALERDPKSPIARPRLLWLFINHRQLEALAVTLDRWKDDVADDPDLWAPYASGYQLLGRLEEALPWFDAEARRHPENYLWLLSYADVLDQARRPGAAWKIRRHIFTRVLPAVGQRLLPEGPETGGEIDEEALRTYVILSKGFFGVPTGDEWMPDLLEAIQESRETEDEDTGEAIGWFLDRGGFQKRPAARIEPASASSRQLAWEFLTSAFNEQDLGAVSGFFREQVERRQQLLLDHAPAARLAQAGGENLLGRKRTAEIPSPAGPTDAELARFETELLHRDRVEVTASAVEIGDLEQVAFAGSWQKFLGEGFFLWLGAGHRTHRADGLDLDGRTRELELDARLEHRHPRWPGMVEAGASVQPVDSTGRLKARQEYRLETWLTPRLELEFHGPSTLSTAMALAGTRHRLAAGLSASLSPRLFATGEVSWNRYQSRSGSRLASGPAAEVNLGYQVYAEDPRLELSLGASWMATDRVEAVPDPFRRLFNRAVTAEEIVPARATVVGLGARVTNREGSLARMRQKRWRYSLALRGGWLWPSETQVWEVRGDLGVRTFIDDEFRVELFYSEGIGGLEAQRNKGIGLTYQATF